MKTVSWIILTHNRSETVKNSIAHNRLHADYPINELIWVDNGSQDDVHEVMSYHKPDVEIYNRKNLGVAKGYNRGYAMATSDLVVITGCDRMMPRSWLKKMVHLQMSREGIVSIYSKPMQLCYERLRSEPIMAEQIIPYGLSFEYSEGMPFEARLLSRELFLEIGFLREDFGLYGWEDVEWAERAEKVLKKKGLKSFVLTSEIAMHIGSEGIDPYNGKDSDTYHAFKKREAENPVTKERLEAARQLGHPYYNPYVLPDAIKR